MLKRETFMLKRETETERKRWVCKTRVVLYFGNNKKNTVKALIVIIY